jgi:hypothetical protein
MKPLVRTPDYRSDRTLGRTYHVMSVRNAISGATIISMSEGSLARIAALLHERNSIDAELAGLIQRPMTSGHLGEWIAAQIFNIELEASAAAAGIDGRFRSGPLQNRTVNIKWYLKREGLLDTTESAELDFYLVLTGRPQVHRPHAAPPGRGASKPCSYLMRDSFGPNRSRAE